MATSMNNKMEAEAQYKEKIETTYRYTPILGNILGFWKIASKKSMGNEVHLHLAWDISQYDHIFVNGTKVKIAPYHEGESISSRP